MLAPYQTLACTPHSPSSQHTSCCSSELHLFLFSNVHPVSGQEITQDYSFWPRSISLSDHRATPPRPCQDQRTFPPLRIPTTMRGRNAHTILTNHGIKYTEYGSIHDTLGSTVCEASSYLERKNADPIIFYINASLNLILQHSNCQ